MNRRNFLLDTTLIGTAGLLQPNRLFAAPAEEVNAGTLYQQFKNPPAHLHPYVRWWWNGDKVEKAELLRELKVLQAAGIGGVEINPIKFPQRTDDLGKKSLRWLSDEWIEMLDFSLTEAKKLGLTCDLIVGSGWPFGAEYLQGEEQAEIVTIAAKKLEGMLDYEVPLFDFLKEADPATTSPFSQRKLTVQRVMMVPDPMNSLDEVIDLSDQITSGIIKIKIPKGKYTVYAQVKTEAFLEVINGAPGANGQVLNHFNKAAVEKYLNKMTDTIQQKIGPLKGRVRALFTDSMELEGANWCSDMSTEFQQRRGYDLMPYLPLILFRIGGMGNVYDYGYGTGFTPEFNNIIQRVRLDFDLTKTELTRERFITPFQQWCRKNGMQSRVQSYGRGYHPLEGSLGMDIPEGETWIKPGYGFEMPDDDYKKGRGYTMSNKFVSSAAHLEGKRMVSCEECTNTDVVFNTTLQLLKLCSDQSILSGITHSIYHGFNYSPPEAPFPGWVRYGNYMNEHNTYWPYFHQLNAYRARVSTLLQEADFFADIAILPGIFDMWSKFGAQNEPFPSLTYPDYLSLVWEGIHQSGNGCDYVSEKIIDKATISKGRMQYGKRSYHTLMLVSVETMSENIANKLLEFAKSGGKIVAMETLPHKGIGFQNFKEKDKATQKVIDSLKAMPQNFISIKKPAGNYAGWFRGLQEELGFSPYTAIEGGNPFISQVRYSHPDFEMLLVMNSNYTNTTPIILRPEQQLIKKGNAFLWDATNGTRHSLPNSKEIHLVMEPADFKVIVFEKLSTRSIPALVEKPMVPSGTPGIENWKLQLHHINGKIFEDAFHELKDLKETKYADFTGTITYSTSFPGNNAQWLDLGVVHGISHVKLNGKDIGNRWYGRHLYDLKGLVKQGLNTLEVKVAVVMGNYLKTLTDNDVAQYWTNQKRKNQPIQSLGMVGPVKIF